MIGLLSQFRPSGIRQGARLTANALKFDSKESWRWPILEASQPKDQYMFDLKWSQAEKVIARQAFDMALQKELQATIHEAKRRAAKVEEPSELWELESWLTERRGDINRRYDYRYSVLPIVFAHLVRDGHLKEDDLQGLDSEKLERIRRGATL
jgi:thymidylate synthase